MTNERTRRNKWLHLRLTEGEYNLVNNSFSNSTKQKRSEYVRAVLLKEPITFYTRSRSFDDFVAEMALLRRELKAIGNNLNQSVKKLHSMNTDAEIKSWAIRNEDNRKIFLGKVEEINAAITQIADKWSQE